MTEKLEIMEKRFDEINEKLTDINVINDQEQYKNLMKELKSLTPIIEKYRMYKTARADYEEAEQMLSDGGLDKDFKEIVQEQYESNKKLMEEYTDELKILLLPKDPDDDRNVIIEIRGGAGGEEAALFANSMFRMYSMYAQAKGWKTVLPEVEEVDVEINPADLEFQTYRSSGAGGQHINKTESAIRIIHHPTGVVVECQEERSQYKNKDKAMKMLYSKLYEAKLNEQNSKIAAERKIQVGTGDRSERIRTYNYPQSRVTDHRIGLTLYKLEQFMNGDCDEVFDALAIADRSAKLAAGGND